MNRVDAAVNERLAVYASTASPPHVADSPDPPAALVLHHAIASASRLNDLADDMDAASPGSKTAVTNRSKAIDALTELTIACFGIDNGVLGKEAFEQSAVLTQTSHIAQGNGFVMELHPIDARKLRRWADSWDLVADGLRPVAWPKSNH